VSETELLRLLDDHDLLVQRCIAGSLPLDEFLREYDDFPFAYALDGHESDEDEKAMFRRYAARISFHFGVMESIYGLCSDEEAKSPSYIKGDGFRPPWPWSA
jgi:hypothetical protein